MILSTKEIINIQYGKEHIGSSGFDKNKKWVSVNDLKNEICNMIISYEEGDINDVDEFAIKLLEKLNEEKK